MLPLPLSMDGLVLSWWSFDLLVYTSSSAWQQFASCGVITKSMGSGSCAVPRGSSTPVTTLRAVGLHARFSPGRNAGRMYHPASRLAWVTSVLAPDMQGSHAPQRPAATLVQSCLHRLCKPHRALTVCHSDTLCPCDPSLISLQGGLSQHACKLLRLSTSCPGNDSLLSTSWH